MSKEQATPEQIVKDLLTAIAVLKEQKAILREALEDAIQRGTDKFPVRAWAIAASESCKGWEVVANAVRAAQGTSLGNWEAIPESPGMYRPKDKPAA
jgi:hypothetical protein